MHEDIAAGIVLYNPEKDRLIENINAIKSQVQKIYLIDNASDNRKDIEAIVRLYPKCFLIRNKENQGVASALNQIFSIAQAEGYGWLLTLDDDSVCSTDMIAQLMKYTNISQIGIICPRAVDDKIDIAETKIYEEYEFVNDCITAGALTNIKVWQEVGKFDEKMFIDFVDIEFCVRVRQLGYMICRVNRTKVHQRYGDIKGAISIFGKKMYLFGYSPLRVYYSVRNQIYYIKKHHTSLNVTKQVLFLIGYIGKRIVFEGERVKTLREVFRGIRDGFKM